jgi:outer membrane protein OmpA-like peptidoglycan-associated protein
MGYFGTSIMQIKTGYLILPFSILLLSNSMAAQTNLLLNGNFEDINTCTEYNAACGVEGWFYLNEVKVQMLNNEINSGLRGSNSIGIFYNWSGYTGFTPVIGTRLPCNLQKNNRYTFRGIISAKLNAKLNLKPGICLGEKFYVPKRAFSKNMKPDSIVLLKAVPNTSYYEFEYSFVADGKEKYLAFGSFVEVDTVRVKWKLTGMQTVSLILDNFQLIAEDNRETFCPDFLLNKEEIYKYNFRHREMDYSLFGRGELNITFPHSDSNNVTQVTDPQPVIAKADTLKLGDVYFDFNKASLKPGALNMLVSFFIRNKNGETTDSIYVEGHTDSIGTDKRNLELSLKRCESVRQWLLQNNIAAGTRIAVHPFGKSKPIATNSTPQGRAINRRVEMIVFRNPKK